MPLTGPELNQLLKDLVSLVSWSHVDGDDFRATLHQVIDRDDYGQLIAQVDQEREDREMAARLDLEA